MLAKITIIYGNKNAVLYLPHITDLMGNLAIYSSKDYVVGLYKKEVVTESLKESKTYSDH